MKQAVVTLRCAAIALLAFLAGGCDRMVVLNPKGPIADAERGLMIDAFTVMMIVVVPVIVMALLFAWRYQSSRSYWALVLEHALYGNLIFTVGLGRYFYTGVSNF